MNFDDLKSGWKNAGGESRSPQEIEKMTLTGNHPILKKVRIKLIIEAVLLFALLFAYYDGFDGDKKPVYINLLLAFSITLYLANNVAGFYLLKSPKTGLNIRESIHFQLKRLKNAASFSMVSSLFYGISLLAFLTSGIVFNQRKYIIMAGLVIAFFLLFYYSWISWQRKISHFEKMKAEF